MFSKHLIKKNEIIHLYIIDIKFIITIDTKLDTIEIKFDNSFKHKFHFMFFNT